MLSAFTNSLKIPELRQKIFFTLALLFIARVGANIPLPGVDPSPIKEFFELREQTRSDTGSNDILGFMILQACGDENVIKMSFFQIASEWVSILAQICDRTICRGTLLTLTPLQCYIETYTYRIQVTKYVKIW